MKPRPEFVVGDSKRWQHLDDAPLHGERRADPLRRKTRAEHGEGDEARVSRLVALVAGSFDGRQRRSTPAKWLEHKIPERGVALRLFDAATDARNRATVRRVYGEALERPLVPSVVARRHAREFERQAKGEPTNAHEVALEVLALIDDTQALDEYCAAMRSIAPEYAGASSGIAYRGRELRDDCHPSRMRGTRRIWQQRTPTSGGTKPRRVSKAHAIAYDLVIEALDYAARLGKSAANDAGNRQRVEAREKALESAAKPPEGYAHGAPPPRGAITYSHWHKLNPNEPERPVAHTGRCGRSRSATMTGKTPRYLSRLITDPERRVFSRMTRGTRALVVVDLSGSMSLSVEDLERIMSASVGATVVGYAAHNDTAPNCHLLAHRGRRVRVIPRNSGGNGVDAPAFVWACRRFARSSTPVLWITDCQAVGNVGQSFEVLDECRKVAKHYGARIEGDLESALGALEDLRRGKARPSNPQRFEQVITSKGYARSEA